MGQDYIHKIVGQALPRGLPKLFRPIAVILLALATGAVFIKLMGTSPLEAYRGLLLGSLGSVNGIAETLVKASPLVLTGLSFAFAFRCGLINIGAEGQLYMGGFCSIFVGIYLRGLPALIHLPLALAAGFVGGGLWGFLAGWLKVRFGANEIITTVMLNYLAMLWISYLVTGPMKEPPGIFPQTAPAAITAQLPRILPGTRLHLGFLIALLALLFYYLFLYHTPRGFEMRLVGQNQEAARYAGMKPKANILLAMFLAGGMAGLAGAGELLGIQGRMLAGFSPGYGFDGLSVSLLGANGPVGIFLAAVLFGILRAGGNMMQLLSGVRVSLIYVIQALVILFVLAEPGFKSLWKSLFKDTRRRTDETIASAGQGEAS